MPTITVEGPPLGDVDRKRDLVRRLTDVAVDVYAIEHIVVLIKENVPENVGVDGTLVCDRAKPASSA
jgi:4-oxalocrotonate tautomerase